MNGIKPLLTFVVILSCFNGIQSNLSLEEILDLMKALREACQTKTSVSDDLIDGINLGQFPDNKDLMCYTHCLLESFNMIRKGKFKADLALKQIKIYMPEGIRESWIKGVEACRSIGDNIQDPCQRSYSLVECFYNNNEHFMFP